MIHLIIGRQGSGKTLFMVKKAYEYYKQGRTVYSNVHLNFPYKKLRYDDIVNYRLKNGIVIIDEIHQLLNSRKAMTKRSIKICSGFLSMVRKQGLEVFGSTQLLRKVDINFREETAYFYVCSEWQDSNKQWKETTHNYNLSLDIPIMINLKIIESFSEQELNMCFIGNNYFDMYDSTQLIEIDDDSGVEQNDNKKQITFKTDRKVK